MLERMSVAVTYAPASPIGPMAKFGKPPTPYKKVTPKEIMK
jgi:hypothetical protein